MSRTTKKETLEAQAQAEQTPALFDDHNLPVRHELLGQVEARVYEHTGARLLDNERECLRLVEMLLAGLGVKAIAREMSVSPKTVRAARRALEKQGKLAPFKQRVTEKFADIIEAGADAYLDAVENGYVSPAQIPVGLGIIFDKRAAALGEPTAVLGVAADPNRRAELSVEALNAFVDGLKVATVIDVQSNVTPASTEEKPTP